MMPEAATKLLAGEGSTDVGQPTARRPQTRRADLPVVARQPANLSPTARQTTVIRPCDTAECMGADTGRADGTERSEVPR